MSITDLRNRPLRDLRISLTDRCNFRCAYCMPKEVFGADYAFLSRQAVLNEQEILRLTKIFANLGVTKVRLTGGEPLLRADLLSIVEQIANIDGIEDIAMTTNGSRLTPELAKKLKQAGLKRITISLDSLDDGIFQRLNDVGCSVNTVLTAIDAAQHAGLSPVKINMVVMKGINDHEIEAMAAFGRDKGVIIRFIEFMDVGNSNHWNLDQVVPAKEILARVGARFPIQKTAALERGEVANRYLYEDGLGEIGVIASVTAPFCGACTRARLSAEGRLFLCLFASQGFDLKSPLREGKGDDDIQKIIENLWHHRDDRYSELRMTQKSATRKVEMSHIGG